MENKENIFYHGTTTKYLADIKKYGLLPRRGIGTKYYCDGKLIKAIALTTTKKKAIMWAHRKIFNDGCGFPRVIKLYCDYKYILPGRDKDYPEKMYHISLKKILPKQFIKIYKIKARNKNSIVYKGVKYHNMSKKKEEALWRKK